MSCYNKYGENMKKKRKLKIKNILILVVFLILFVFFVKSIWPKKDFQVVLQNSNINYQSDYVPIFSATYKGKQVTSKVEYENTIDTSVLGKQKLFFSYYINDKTYSVTKTVVVKDLEAPQIILKGGKQINALKNVEFKDPGYEVTDNLDENLEKKVHVSGKVNTKKDGSYTLTYSVKDKSGNQTVVKRTVKVSAESPLNMSIEDFHLDGYFSDVILKETEDYGADYTNDFIFAGDSMALYYVINELISGKQLWHQISINPETALTSSIYINHIDTKKTFVENMKDKKPDKMIFTLGTNGAAYMKTTYFIECYKKLLEEMQKMSPNTLLIVQSIPPVDSKYDSFEKGINNKKINELNYYIAQMCSELGIPFLNSAEAMKDFSGACKKGYCIESDGIHPTKAGQQMMLKYAQTHAYIKK